MVCSLTSNDPSRVRWRAVMEPYTATYRPSRKTWHGKPFDIVPSEALLRCDQSPAWNGSRGLARGATLTHPHGCGTLEGEGSWLPPARVLTLYLTPATVSRTGPCRTSGGWPYARRRRQRVYAPRGSCRGGSDERRGSKRLSPLSTCVGDSVGTQPRRGRLLRVHAHAHLVGHYHVDRGPSSDRRRNRELRAVIATSAADPV